jgi:hypothetical protein
MEAQVEKMIVEILASDVSRAPENSRCRPNLITIGFVAAILITRNACERREVDRQPGPLTLFRPNFWFKGENVAWRFLEPASI